MMKTRRNSRLELARAATLLSADAVAVARSTLGHDRASHREGAGPPVRGDGEASRLAVCHRLAAGGEHALLAHADRQDTHRRASSVTLADQLHAGRLPGDGR